MIDFSIEVRAKARRYLRQQRVFATDAPGRYIVRGSAPRPYVVHTDADPVRRRVSYISCSCSHGTYQGAGAAWCSHAAAVLIALQEGIALPVTEALLDEDLTGSYRSSDDEDVREAARSIGPSQPVRVFYLMARLDPGREYGVTAGDTEHFGRWIERELPGSIQEIFGTAKQWEGLRRETNRDKILIDRLGWLEQARVGGRLVKRPAPLNQFPRPVYFFTDLGWANRERARECLLDPDLFDRLFADYPGLLADSSD